MKKPNAINNAIYEAIITGYTWRDEGHKAGAEGRGIGINRPMNR